MPNSSTSSFSYETLIKSIGIFDEVQKTIVKDKASMISIADKVVNREADISKFIQAKTQVESFLDGYDFRDGFQFVEMNKKIDSLLLLRSKLAIMGEEAKKLSTRPDRYGSQRAIGLCRDLAIKCKERLKLEEADKAVALAVANTQKLISIRSQFESDGDVLYQINEAIDSNMNVLGKFKAYLAEIRRYVDAFPHSGQDDLSEINGRIDAAKQIDVLLGCIFSVHECIYNHLTNNNVSERKSDFAFFKIKLIRKMLCCKIKKLVITFYEICFNNQTIIISVCVYFFY